MAALALGEDTGEEQSSAEERFRLRTIVASGGGGLGEERVWCLCEGGLLIVKKFGSIPNIGLDRQIKKMMVANDE